MSCVQFEYGHIEICRIIIWHHWCQKSQDKSEYSTFE